ncbi:hypothetical protein ACVII0_001466 [Sinorhizobium meliloti]
MQQEISALTEQLAPAGADEIGHCIQGLMSGGLRISETITAANPVEEYRLSLRNVPVYGLRRAYVKLKRVEYENINRAFIPLPAEFAALASAECRLIREDRIRKQETLRAIEDSISRTLPSSHGLMDLRVSQRERASELAEKGFVRAAEGVDHLEFAHLPKSRELPAGSHQLRAIDEVWSPIAVRVNCSRIQTKLNVQPPPVSPERADELARMLALPDTSQVTAGTDGVSRQGKQLRISGGDELSAYHIAKRFGVSRNVIVGLAFRTAVCSRAGRKTCAPAQRMLIVSQHRRPVSVLCGGSNGSLLSKPPIQSLSPTGYFMTVHQTQFDRQAHHYAAVKARLTGEPKRVMIRVDMRHAAPIKPVRLKASTRDQQNEFIKHRCQQLRVCCKTITAERLSPRVKTIRDQILMEVKERWPNAHAIRLGELLTGRRTPFAISWRR